MPQNPPRGYHTVTPQSVVAEPRQVIDFTRQVLGATLDDQYVVDDVIVHAEIVLGDSRIMIGASNEDYPPMPLSTHTYVDDVDAVYERAIEFGATSIQPPTDQFYGDRTGVVRDTQGNQWSLATAVENVSQEEMRRRLAEMSG
jgi:PhnB protein